MPVAKVFDPYTGGAVGGVVPSGGGPVDVQPPAATSEAVGPGASFANKTFGSFTGADVGLIASYTLETVNSVGTTSWSGTGLGPYTASGAADGDSGTLLLKALDSSANVLATAAHSYDREATPAAATWNEINRFDLTGLDAANITPPSAAGYQVNLTKSGAPFLDMYLDYSGTGLVFDVNASAAGVRADWVSGTSNYLSQAIKVNDLLGVALMDPTLWRGRYAFQMLVDNITYAGQNSERFGLYISSNYETMLGPGNSAGVTIMDNGAGGTTISLWNGTDAAEYTSQPLITGACFTFVISNGAMFDVMISTAAGATYVDPYTVDYGPMLVHRSPTQGIPYYDTYSDAYVGAISRRKTNGTITGFRVLKFE